jgi:hypothetical protein
MQITSKEPYSQTALLRRILVIPNTMQQQPFIITVYTVLLWSLSLFLQDFALITRLWYRSVYGPGLTSSLIYKP